MKLYDGKEAAPGITCNGALTLSENIADLGAMVGGIRDAVLFQDFKLLYGFVAIFLVVLIGNLVTGNFHPGFTLQPIAHSNHLWNLLGMVLVGWGSVLLGGCPLRQLILAGEGNGDSAVTVFGMISGAALAHNFGLAGSPDALNDAKELVVGGISNAGKVAVILGFVVFAVISMVFQYRFGIRV